MITRRRWEEAELTWEKKVEMTVGVVAHATERVLNGILAKERGVPVGCRTESGAKEIRVVCLNTWSIRVM